MKSDRTRKYRGIAEIEATDSSDDSYSDGDSDNDYSSVGRSRNRGKVFYKDVVEPEKFSLSSACSVKTFLNDFERYFHTKYAGNQRDCCRELGRFLVGEVKSAYDALGGPQVKYSEIEIGLVKWYKKQQVGKQHVRRAELRSATMNSGETFTLYCMRLQELAVRAFPGDEYEAAKELKRRVLATVPQWFVICIEKREEMKRMLKKGK